MSEHESTVSYLYRLAFMPGCFRCLTCGYVLIKRCIDATSGTIGTREQDRESEPCPNDGAMMVHVTYREWLEVYVERLKEEFDRRYALVTPRPLSEWHEDIGPVLWHHFPIEAPPFCGTPLDSDWPYDEWWDDSGKEVVYWTPLPDCNEIQRRFDEAQGAEKRMEEA